MVRLLAAALDVALISMLVTFAIDAKVRRDFPRWQWLSLAALTWAVLAVAVAADNDDFYLIVGCVYALCIIFALSIRGRLRIICATLLLMLVACFPLNTLVFVLNVLGIDVVFGYGDALYALAAMSSVAVIFWVWRQRRRYNDELAVRFSVPEGLLAVFLFLLTTLFGIVLNPKSGELNAEVLSTGSGTFLVTMVAVLVVFLNISFLVMVWRSKTTAYYRRMNTLNAQYVGMELQYFESYKQAQTDIRTFRHDMKHHLAQMQQLCKMGDISALSEYLAQFQDEWQETAYRLYQTGNDQIDALLNGRAARFHKEHIVVTVVGSFTSKLVLSPFDLCAIFANALDNAIEENARLPENAVRWLRFEIRKNEHYHVVTVENPLAGKLANSARTKKADARNHGFGLYSIREKTEKNGGSIEVVQTDGCYQLNIFLPR